jgi:hypothetical protein
LAGDPHTTSARLTSYVPPIRAGLLSGSGRAGPVLASGVEPGDRIGITVEPAGGTSSPTTTPVIAVPV